MHATKMDQSSSEENDTVISKCVTIQHSKKTDMISKHYFAEGNEALNIVTLTRVLPPEFILK